MKRGFTLIELLVVIAIIAILAAILFPVFAKAREKAQQASCLSNEKEICLAILMYCQDFDEMMPKTEGYTRDSIWQGYWYVAIKPYTKNDDLFLCPSDGRAGIINPNYKKYRNSYVMNPVIPGSNNNAGVPQRTFCLGAPTWDPDPTATPPQNSRWNILTLAQFDTPANTWMISENFWGYVYDVRYLQAGCMVSSLGFPYPLYDFTGHNAGLNFGFVDGHVKWYSGSGMTYSSPRWDYR